MESLQNINSDIICLSGRSYGLPLVNLVMLYQEQKENKTDQQIPRRFRHEIYCSICALNHNLRITRKKVILTYAGF